MRYLSDERTSALLERIRNQTRRLHMLKSRHNRILPAVGAAVAQMQASCDAALAADSERLLMRVSNLARTWINAANPNDELEREIDQLLEYLERRRYPRRWINGDLKTPDAPVDGLIHNNNNHINDDEDDEDDNEDEENNVGQVD